MAKTNMKALDIAKKEGVECSDCIWEALASVGYIGVRDNPRLNKEERMKFIEHLHGYSMDCELER